MGCKGDKHVWIWMPGDTLAAPPSDLPCECGALTLGEALQATERVTVVGSEDIHIGSIDVAGPSADRAYGLRDHLNELLADDVFRIQYEQLGPRSMVAEAIIRARQERGWSQAELARRVGLSRNEISNIECCATNPKLETLRRIAEALGMRLVVRFEGENNE